MKCPRCDELLNISQREGVEIDTCPRCRGVWLDRGELEKILSRANDDYDDDDRRRSQYQQRPPEHQGYRYEKRKSFWSELFD